MPNNTETYSHVKLNVDLPLANSPRCVVIFLVLAFRGFILIHSFFNYIPTNGSLLNNSSPWESINGLTNNDLLQR